jgi:DNA-binding NarL/FixJ family response regulator
MPSAFLLRAHPDALQRSKTALLGCEGWELAGSAQRGREALERIPLLQPDLLLADQRLLDGPLERLLIRLERSAPQLPVLIWTSHPDDPALVDCLLLGVRDVLPETFDPRPSVLSGQLAPMLKAALEGRHRLNPALARELLRRLNTPRLALQEAVQPDKARDAQGAGMRRLLSVAQQALLSLLAHGYLPREIALAWRLDVEEIERRVGQLLRLLPRLVGEPASGRHALA